MKIGLLLSGCGVYDGAEIQESVLAMLAIKNNGAEYTCISIDKNQHHVVNHITGEEMNESRNMMVESARIARGEVKLISEVNPSNIDGLVIPGGFGSAKNFSDWAFNGPDGQILPEVKLLLVNMINAGKPVAALCVSPILVAKALEGSNIETNLTMGNSIGKSPYTISDFHGGLNKTGATTAEKSISEILIDKTNKIVTAPCYMFDASIVEVNKNINQAVKALIELVNE